VLKTTHRKLKVWGEEKAPQSQKEDQTEQLRCGTTFLDKNGVMREIRKELGGLGERGDLKTTARSKKWPPGKQVLNR